MLKVMAHSCRICGAAGQALADRLIERAEAFPILLGVIKEFDVRSSRFIRCDQTWYMVPVIEKIKKTHSEIISVSKN
jgi:hypothetical protein